MFRDANLNHSRGQQYLEFCQDRGLVRRSGRGFSLTEEGRSYLAEWRKIQDMLSEADLDDV